MKKPIAAVIVSIFLCLFIVKVTADNNGECYLEGVSDADWTTYFTNDAVEDTERSIFKNFSAANISAVTLSGTSSSYIQVTLGDGYFLVAPSSEFANFEKNEPSSSTSPTLTVTFSFTCVGGSSELTFRQPVTDINNNEPEFASSYYSYALPMPFPSGISISGIFGDSIYASDIDITNTALTFSIYPEGDFTIAYSGPTDSTYKTHLAILKSASTIRLTSTTTYILTVTDQGTIPGTLSTNATLIIEVDDDNSVIASPVFESSYYTADYVDSSDSNDSITHSAITLTDSDYENTTFTIGGDYADYFTVSSGTDGLNLILTQDLSDEVIQELSYVVVTITASRINAEYNGATVVIVNIPEMIVSSVSSPVFSSPYHTSTYMVNANGSDTVSLSSTISLTDNDLENTNITIEEYSNYFSINISNNQIDVVLTADLPDEIIYSSYFILIPVKASRKDSETDGYTILAVELPGEECTQTTISESTTITTENPIVTTTDPIVTTLNPTVTPESSTSYTTECPTITECPTVTECPTITTVTSSICECDCSTVTSTTLSSNNTEVTTEATTQAPLVTITFEKDYYSFGLEPLHVIGVIGAISASSSIDESITYSLEASSESSLPTELSINGTTGSLITSDYIPSGSYYLIALATGATSGVIGSTSIYVYVGSIQICSDDVRTIYSVITKHITEEEQNYDILTFDQSFSLENYTYVILEQFPSTNPFVFEINSTTGSVQTSQIIDREWVGISDMYVSQFTIRIRLIEVGETVEITLSDNSSSIYAYDEVSPRSTYNEDGRAWINVENTIYNVAYETVIAIVVDDINDNAPAFTHSSPLIIGYPDEDLIDQIAPPFLTQVQATDADVGENAIITYTSDSSNVFINEYTGIIYLISKDFNNEDYLEFSVKATDKNGTSDGLSTTLEVQVKKLKEDHLTVLTILGGSLENIADYLELLSSTSGLTVKELTSSVIPSGVSSSFTRNKRSSSDYSLRLIVYALDSDNELVESEDLQEAISSSDISEFYSIVSWSEYSQNTSPKSTSTIGYLVSVITLSILVVLLIAAAITFYCVYFKRITKHYQEMKEEYTPPMYPKNEVNSLTTASIKSDLASRRPTSYPVDSPVVNGFEPQAKKDQNQPPHFTRTSSALSERRPTEFVFIKPGDEVDDHIYESSTDDYESQQHNNEVCDPKIRSPPSLERRKSVSFNVNVEKIEIEKDDDDEDEDESQDVRL